MNKHLKVRHSASFVKGDACHAVGNGINSRSDCSALIRLAKLSNISKEYEVLVDLLANIRTTGEQGRGGGAGGRAINLHIHLEYVRIWPFEQELDKFYSV